MTKIQNI